MLIFPGVYKLTEGFENDQYEIVLSIDLEEEVFTGYIHTRSIPIPDYMYPVSHPYLYALDWSRDERWEHVDS